MGQEIMKCIMLTLNSFIWHSLTLDIPLSAIISGRHTRPPSEAMWMQCWKYSYTVSTSSISCKTITEQGNISENCKIKTDEDHSGP